MKRKLIIKMTKKSKNKQAESIKAPEKLVPKPQEREMPFLAHLEELRIRLIRIVIAIVIGFALSYYFAENIFNILMMPIIGLFPPKQGNLHFTGLIEPFITYLKVGILSGFFIAFPYIFSQIWGFVAPGLYKNERKYVVPFIIMGSFFFMCGAMFGYFIVFPLGFKFFLSFATEDIKPILTIKEYLSLTTKLLIGFGVIFETPLVISFLSLTGVVRAKTFLKAWRWAIIGSFAVAAILTPPDVGTMCLMSVPLIILYFASCGFAYLFDRNKEE
ncbi:MAG: twin-arginine translocase subunit TatC [Pseudomonadota bacterium]